MRIGGVDVPLTAVFGGLGTFGAFVVAMVLDPVVLATGGGWMVVRDAALHRLPPRQGLPLTETVKVGSSPRSASRRSSMSVLVAFDEDDPFSEEAMATAKALAAKRSRAIHVLSLVKVPANLPLDAPLGGAEARARARSSGRS